MNKSELESIRDVWLSEKEKYNNYGEELLTEIKNVIGFNIPSERINYRLKDTQSLLKKCRDKNYSYDEINDKVGIRAVVDFISDLNKYDEKIQKHFDTRIIKREDKRKTTDEKTFGYLSIHYEIKNDEGLICEFQLRTICQDTWSTLAHKLTYKKDIDIPKEVKREVNALSALLEIADNQFEKIKNMIEQLPLTNPTKILYSISGFYNTYISAWYDINLSYSFLYKIESLYDEDEDISNTVIAFAEKNREKIETITKSNTSIWYSQPEIIIIFERLENKKFKLEEYWGKYIDDIEYLRDIASDWGVAID